jgi:thiamine-monophosphate kinase
MSADEFEVIRTHFAPLAADPHARGLQDDAAVVTSPEPIVVTTDTIVEGVHFLPGDPIETIALKALRVSVSDLVGKAAQPWGTLLNLTWPQHRPAAEVGRFAASLGRDLKHYNMTLLGGDTTSTPGPLVVTTTAFGRPIGSRTPSRSDAKAGDDIWLAGGEIGSAWLGLQLRTGAIGWEALQRGREPELGAFYGEAALEASTPSYLKPPGGKFDAEVAWLMSAYLAPMVRLECAAIVARFARASMDVSDGLVADAEKLALASGVKLRIGLSGVPLSIPAERWLRNGGDIRALLTGGDDYVVLFTAAPEDRTAIAANDPGGELRLSRIGSVEAGEGVVVDDGEHRPLAFERGGFSHSLGR